MFEVGSRTLTFYDGYDIKIPSGKGRGRVDTSSTPGLVAVKTADSGSPTPLGLGTTLLFTRAKVNIHAQPPGYFKDHDAHVADWSSSF